LERNSNLPKSPSGRIHTKCLTVPLTWEYGYYMCLKSGWLDSLKLCIDRVLKNPKFAGVYYDWNLALYCNDPLHTGGGENITIPADNAVVIRLK
jgi:hypothetical protein